MQRIQSCSLMANVLPSWTAPGRNIRERIDNWQCNQPQQASPNTVSTNFSGYNPIDVQDDHRSPVFSLDNSITNWGIEEAVDDEWPYVSEMSQQEIDEIRILEALVVETRKKVDTAKRKLARTSLPVLCSAAKNPIITAHLPPPTVSKSIPTAPSSFPAIAKLSPPPPAVPRSSPMPHLPNCQHFEFHTAIKDPKLVDSASEVVTEKAATSSTPDASKESASFHCEPDSDVAIVESLETSAFLSNSIPSSPTNDDPEPVDSKMYELRPFHTVSQASTRHCPARNARVTLADPNLPRVITAPTLPCNRNHTQSNPITSVNVVEITEDSLTNDCAGIREETPFSTIDPSDTPYTLHDFLPLPPLQFHAQLNYPHFNSCSSQPEDPGWPPPIAFLANLGPPAIPHIYPSPIQFF
ncbi:hypothetical protein BKA70DRAFT_59153 [Coprinopsis sp. MPI-PUGE-AT-0042]|nr:hypothetical protein BKA70DRAFT_59153 [Coprinopsis sp. MPI-PUGE-AT-0042]